MIKKRETCLYCGEKMESKTAKKKFCSELHRVYYNREKERGTLGLDIKIKDGQAVVVKSERETVLPTPIIDNSTRISELEEELKTVPENTTLGKRRRAWLNSEIYKLKNKIN